MQTSPNGRWLLFLTYLSDKLLDFCCGRSRSEKELGETCLATWDTLKYEMFESLVCSMPERVEAVINAKGRYSRF